MNLLKKTFFIATLIVISGCSSIPSEVVQLSYVMGKDLDALRLSYRELIHQHFESLRAQRMLYLDREWKPAFIRAWIDDGHLIQMASGKEAYSSSDGGFISPTPGKTEIQLLDGVSGWAEDAIEQINNKKSELLEPLNKDERELILAVEESFDRLSRGNAVITAHLNSLTKVQAIQDDFMAAMDMGGLRSAINSKLAETSKNADKALESIRKADQRITKAR